MPNNNEPSNPDGDIPRRDFIKKIVAAGAFAALPGCGAPKPAETDARSLLEKNIKKVEQERMAKLSPELRAQLEIDAANTVPETPILAAQRNTGYRVLYVAVDGCGGKTHNFSNLRRLNTSGINVQYVNSNPLPDRMPVTGNPPGRQINDTREQGLELLSRYGLKVFSSDVLLIDANNRVIGRFDSRPDNFVSSVLSRIPQQSRGSQL